ncbi:lipopolysaccharide assembly protein LapB [Flavobacterium antarcticum]|uniref:tetratricopeptide repeat protein n=1 Tax=Flavobacterium antarcticum TaxID=271155 RepID=UPI0003B4231D|nr:tetratricopeptide repeat protein [Flavobacterium antarcticum]
MKKFTIGFLLIAVCSSAFSQKEPDDIALATNEFQISYYEALKQKGIENNDRAIQSLQKCVSLEPNNAAVYNELGRNYLKLKKYKEAYDSFEKAFQIDPKNRWYLHGMYDVAYQTQDFNQAIILVTKLVAFEPNYKEDLTSLYMYTQQYDKALVLINEMNDDLGKSEKRDNYKKQIMQDARFQGSEKDDLLKLIAKNPKDESNYIALIYLYSNSNQEEKALEVAKKLEIAIPNSDWAQVSLFKFHLNNNDGPKAVKSMHQILDSDKIDNKIKHRVLNEFLIFAKNNPGYDADLMKAVSYFNSDKEVAVAKEVGKFFQSKSEWNQAKSYYEMDLKNNPNDLESALLLFEMYVKLEQFEALAKKSEEMTELFPSQPDLYYYAGLANNQLKKFAKAKDYLESGMDYVIENKALEINFNIQLGEAYNGLGDQKKKELYFKKAEQLLKK